MTISYASYASPTSAPLPKTCCTPDNWRAIGKNGMCATTNDLDAKCGVLEISASKDCGAFDGNWCCYSKEVYSAVQGTFHLNNPKCEDKIAVLLSQYFVLSIGRVVFFALMLLFSHTIRFKQTNPPNFMIHSNGSDRHVAAISGNKDQKDCFEFRKRGPGTSTLRINARKTQQASET